MAKDAKKKAAKKPESVMVVNDRPHLVFFGGTKLMPGVNNVPAAVAEQMKKNSHITDLKTLHIHDAPPSTKDLEPEEAKDLVAKTNVPEVLDDLRADESRPDVVAAITDQKAAIGPTDVKKG